MIKIRQRYHALWAAGAPAQRPPQPLYPVFMTGQG